MILVDAVRMLECKNHFAKILKEYVVKTFLKSIYVFNSDVSMY